MTRNRSIIVFLPIVLVAVIVDRLTKVWAADTLRTPDTAPDFGIVELYLVHNEGAAFGIGQGNVWLFALIAIVIFAVIVFWLVSAPKRSALSVVALSLVAAGAVGNCIDRILNGYVIDFLNFTFINFPVFNVADICVTCGVILFIFTLFFQSDFSEDGKDE